MGSRFTINYYFKISFILYLRYKISSKVSKISDKENYMYKTSYIVYEISL